MAAVTENQTHLLSSLDTFCAPGAEPSRPIDEAVTPDMVRRKPQSCADKANSLDTTGPTTSKKRPRRSLLPLAAAKSEAYVEDVEPFQGTECSKPARRYRQAKETTDGVVEVLCFSCRRTKDTKVQQCVTAFFKKKAPDVVEPAGESAVVVVEDIAPLVVDTSICAKCRRPLVQKHASPRNVSGELPQFKRWKSYKRIAKQQGVPFNITEKFSSGIMRSACSVCGVSAPLKGHGLTRLRKWPAGTERPAKGGFMGPYVAENLAAACAMCNLMKGYQTIRGVVERCRHIATQHTPGETFGEYPHRFRDNVTKRARSGYVTNSSTHTKTHALTNDEFNRIVAQRCYYCHKLPRKPKTFGPEDRGHFNGLDRLDSDNRVYTTETVVACCGDCNMMKYKWPLDVFLDQCRSVARFNSGHEFADDEPMEGEDDEQDEVDQTAVMEDVQVSEDDGNDDTPRAHVGDVPATRADFEIISD